jgi:hypothetical protein
VSIRLLRRDCAPDVVSSAVLGVLRGSDRGSSRYSMIRFRNAAKLEIARGAGAGDSASGAGVGALNCSVCRTSSASCLASASPLVPTSRLEAAARDALDPRSYGLAVRSVDAFELLRDAARLAAPPAITVSVSKSSPSTADVKGIEVMDVGPPVFRVRFAEDRRARVAEAMCFALASCSRLSICCKT